MQTIITTLATMGTAATLASVPVPGQTSITLERMHDGTDFVYFRCLETNGIKTCEEV